MYYNLKSFVPDWSLRSIIWRFSKFMYNE